MASQAYTFVDIETTGTRIGRDRVIEIGAIRVEDSHIVDTYTSLINPDQTYIPREITAITGITSEMIEYAPQFSAIASRISELCRDSIFVAHNAQFDYGFLKQEFKRCDMTFHPKRLCTVRLARLLYPLLPSHSLASLIEYFDISVEQRHRALADAQAMYTFFSLARSATAESAWEDALRFLIKKPTLPPQLDPLIVDTLPDDPGVYIFYGERNTPLYVGKSVSIRDRVLSHFIQSSEHTKEWYMAHQIHDIKWEKTHGELSALIRESQLIKTLQPLYNRMSRQSRCMTVIRKSQHEGYDCLSFCEEEALYHDQLESVITVFPSKKSAKTFLIDACKTYQLCEKLSGIERATGASACFAYRLGKCKGACIQKEIPLAYNMRVAQAIADKRITPWPYPGMIAIEGVLFDKWCIVSDETQRFRFDVDTYRILRRHLKKAYNSATLVT